MLLSYTCGNCPNNHSEFNLYRPLYNTGVDKLGKRIGIIDNYINTKTSSGSYTQLLKTTTTWNHLKNTRPDVQYKPQNKNASNQQLIQIRKRNGQSYLSTLQGKNMNVDKATKSLTFDGNITYTFNTGYPSNVTLEESALFVKKNVSIVVDPNAKIVISDNDTITWSDYSDINKNKRFNENMVYLYYSKNTSTKEPISHTDTCTHAPCSQFTDDWTFIGGPGDGIQSIPRVLSNKTGYRSRLINTRPGVDVKHNSYERYLARKKGNVKSCNHF